MNNAVAEMGGKHLPFLWVGDDETFRRQRLVGAEVKLVAKLFEITFQIGLEALLIRFVALVAAGIVIGRVKVRKELFGGHGIGADASKRRIDYHSHFSTMEALSPIGTVLGRANQANGLTVVTVVGVVSVEVAVVEVHVVRVVAIVVRGRPVAAAAAHIVDRSPIAVACSRQEDPCTRR